MTQLSKTVDEANIAIVHELVKTMKVTMDEFNAMATLNETLTWLMARVTITD